MRYVGDIYRAPSEASSLLLQVTIGCSHNRCTFCYMYKQKQFHLRPIEQLKEDVAMAKKAYGSVQRVFLIDGDALYAPTEYLLELLDCINEQFPELERVATSSTARDILAKSEVELKELRSRGLKLIYMGVESGSDEVLKRVCKGVDAAALIEAGQRVKASGIALSVSMIAGLGGTELSSEHAQESARVLSGIDPDYVGLLTLLLHPDAPISRTVNRGALQLLDPEETLKEIRSLVQALEVTDCTFRANHASNYAPLKAHLPEEKQRLLEQLDELLGGQGFIKNEGLRRF